MTVDNEKKKILFAYPPTHLEVERFFSERKILPPTDLMNLASVAEACGFDSKVFDYRLNGDFCCDVEGFKPQFVVAKISIPTFKTEMEILANIKSKYPNIIIIVFGIPFLTYNTNVIYENSFIDYVLVGGDIEFSLQDILNGVPKEDILGICYAENYQGVNVKGIRNEMRPLLENLDALPFPARDLINNEAYENIYSKFPQTVIEVSRGCAYHNFLNLESTILGANIRFRSVDNVIKELEICVNKYNITNFYFMSESFNYDQVWVKDFCNKIIKSGLEIYWETNLTLAPLEEELASLMYRAGCRLVNLPILSGDNNTLKNLGCAYTSEIVQKVSKILNKYKIKIHNLFMVGLPWDTEKSILETIKFAIELGSDYASFNFPAPLPGTPFFAYAMINKLAENELKFDNVYKKPIVRTHELSIEQIVDLQKLATEKFNSSQNIISKLWRRVNKYK